MTRLLLQSLILAGLVSLAMLALVTLMTLGQGIQP